MDNNKIMHLAKIKIHKFTGAIVAIVVFCFIMTLAVMAKFIAKRNAEADFLPSPNAYLQ